MCLQEAIPIAADVAAVASGNPELIAAAAATTAGNYIQTKNNNDSLEAQYNARANTLAQGQQEQQQFANQNQQSLAPAIKANAPSAPDIGSLITARQNAINTNTTPSTGGVSSVDSAAPKVVKDNLASTLANSAAFAKQQGDALGALGATNDQLLGGNLASQEAGRQIGATNTIANTMNTANQAEANANANNARKAPSVWGQGLSDFGTILGLDGLTGGSALTSLSNKASAIRGSLNGAQLATGAPYVASGDYYNAGV